MKEERMLETIGQVKDEFIEEAAPKGVLKSDEEEEKALKLHFSKTKVYRFVKWGALAACFCLVVVLGMKINLFSVTNDEVMRDQSAESESITKETKTEDNFMFKVDSGYTTDYYNTGEDTMTSIEAPTEAPADASAEIPMEDKGFPDWGLTLSVENVTSNGLTLVVTRSGGNPTGNLLTGEAYRLINLVNKTWKTVEELPLPEGVDGRGWNSIAYTFPKEETKEFDINWNWIFGELPAGTYRLIKEFMDFRGTANYDTFEYWVEFEIQ